MAPRKKSSTKRSTKKRSTKSATPRLASSLLAKEKKELHKIAHYCFFIGLLIAIIAGLPWFYSSVNAVALMSTLVFLGFIVGLFNLTAKDTMPFLTASIALMLAGIVNLSLIPLIGDTLRAMLSNIVVFVVPGAIILGMKTIWHMAAE
ncbi:hypothetical protein HOA92_05715 [archaeon]|nr:hypothetical protein [archaeon]MBT6762509.1 hypothetical protein [archaeon]